MSDRNEGRGPGSGGGGQPGGFPGMPPGMAPPSGFVDPFQVWKSWYDAGEQSWAKAMEQMVGTQEYAATMGKTMEAFLAFQRTVRDNMRLYLESVNLPTRDDLARVAEQVVHLEEKIDDLDDRLDELTHAVHALKASASSGSAGGVEAALASLRTEMSELGRKLDAGPKSAGSRRATDSGEAQPPA